MYKNLLKSIKKCVSDIFTVKIDNIVIYIYICKLIIYSYCYYSTIIKYTILTNTTTYESIC